MGNPFNARKPPPQREPLKPTTVTFICKICNKEAGFDPKGILVHTEDQYRLSRGVVTQEFADHDPDVEIIDTTLLEEEDR